MINKFGSDFSTSYKLNLLPGITLPPGYLQTTVSFVSEHFETAHTAYNSSQFNHGNEPSELDCIVGRDVIYLALTTYRHNSFPGNPTVNYAYNLRVDQLILLNLACKLLGYPKKNS